jgi:hypothetical protein
VPIALYADVHIPRAIVEGLRMRHVDVRTAQEDGAGELADPALLDRASALGRVLVTFDDDLLAECARRRREGAFFSGLIYAHPLRISIGQCIRDLEVIATAGEPEDLRNRIEFLPL